MKAGDVGRARRVDTAPRHDCGLVGTTGLLLLALLFASCAAEAVTSGDCVATDSGVTYPDNLITLRVERDDTAGLNYSENRFPPGDEADFLHPITITMPAGSILGPNPDSGVELTFRPYETDWKFGQIPSDLTDGIAGIEIMARLDAGVSIDPGAMLLFSYPLATGSNGIVLDLADLEFERLITSDFRLIAVSMVLWDSEDPADDIDTDALQWTDITAQAGMSTDTTDPDQTVFTFTLPASMFVDAALPVGHSLATSLYITSVECRVDLNLDGSVDVLDHFAFVAAFAENDPLADINRDGAVDVQDTFAFFAQFATGCG